MTAEKLAYVTDDSYKSYITNTTNIETETLTDCDYTYYKYTLKAGALCIQNTSICISSNSSQWFLTLPTFDALRIYTTKVAIQVRNPMYLSINLDSLIKQIQASRNVFNTNSLVKLHFGRNVWPKELNTGSDPELFVLNKAGKVVPSWTFLPAKSSRSLAYPDGFQAELYVGPRYCYEFLIDNIQMSLNQLHYKCKANNPNNTVSWKSIGDCPMVDTFSDENIQLGCKPSYNAYNLKANLESINPRKFIKRPIGMHIHLDMPEDLNWDLITLTKLMDRMVGIPSVSILRGLEDKSRREYYGLPGEYRTPVHGYEYRAISSAALLHPAVCVLHFELARMAWGLHLFQKDIAAEIIDAISDEKVINIMRDLKIIEAKNWSHRLFGIANVSIKEHQNILSPPLRSIYNTAAAFISKGARHFIDTQAFEKHWGLGTENWRTDSIGANTKLNNFSYSQTKDTKILEVTA
jgi:hypothetical protein